MTPEDTFRASLARYQAKVDAGLPTKPKVLPVGLRRLQEANQKHDATHEKDPWFKLWFEGYFSEAEY